MMSRLKRTVTVAGKSQDFPVTINVVKTSQHYDMDDGAGWQGTVTAVLGDPRATYRINRGDIVDVFLDKKANSLMAEHSGGKWKVASEPIRLQRPPVADQFRLF